MMKIIFMGTPDFAVPSLELLLSHTMTIAAVVTAPDKPRGRGLEVSFTPVKQSALKHSLHLLQPESLKDQRFISQLKEFNADLFVIVAFRILPKEVYSLPSKGSFNLHASLLPKYRGAAPINWAIINGEKESGVTTFFLQDTVDTGNVILQTKVPIRNDMNAGELHDRLSVVGAETVLQTVKLIELGKADPQPQNDLGASPAPKIFKETCRIDWNQPAEKIHNFIRGLSPYPAAWSVLNGKDIKIYTSALLHNDVSSFTPQVSERGHIVLRDKNRLCTKAPDGWIEILELQQEGKKRMSAEEFLRGYKFKEGDRFD